MKILQKSLKIGKCIIIGALAVVLLLNLIGIFKRVVLKEQIPVVLGFGSAVIVTGSMEPSVRIGDMIVIHRQNDYQVGDIVTYQLNSPITHRIVEKMPDGYITQGDANNACDPKIEGELIIGKVVLIIPKVGNLTLFFQEPLGMLVLIFGLFAVMESPAIVRKIHNRPRRG